MDYLLFKAINNVAGRYPVMDRLMMFLSNKIRYIFLIVLTCMWFRRHSAKVTVSAVGASLIALLLNMFIKATSFQPRPFMEHPVKMLLPSKNDSRFPSKHTILLFTVSTSIFLRYRVLGSIMMGLSALTAFSRIWVGSHYPSDVVGSAFIGSCISKIVDRQSLSKK